MKNANDRFDEVSKEAVDRVDPYIQFKTKFNAFYKRHKSRRHEVAERAEQETEHLIGAPLTPKLNSKFAKKMADQMASES